MIAANVVGRNQAERRRVTTEVTNTTQANRLPRMNAAKANFHQISGNSSDAETVARTEAKVSMAQVAAELDERKAYPRRGWKPEFKLERLVSLFML